MKDVCFVLAGLAVGCGAVSSGNGDDDDHQSQTLSAPSQVTATANLDHGVRLAWVAPVGADDTTDYHVTASPGDGDVLVSGTNAVATGLVAGTSYTFTVAASNDSGTSPDSDPSPAVTAVTGPAAPTSLFACGANTQVTVRATASAPMAFNIYSDTTDPTLLTDNPDQVASLPVVLTGLTNETARHYIVTAVDANGIESLPTAADTATPSATIHDSMFVSSFRVDAFVEVVDCFSKLATGASAVGRQLGGANVGILPKDYNELAIDPARAILYHRNPTSVLVFDDATRVSGNTKPSRTISSTALTSGRGIAVDTTRDLLYVIDANAHIRVFTNASVANGTVTPAHTIDSAAFALAGSIAIDTVNDRIYVANYSNVLVFDNASTRNGSITPTRTITLTGTTLSSFGVALDASADLLYIASRDEGMVSSIPASTSNGAVTPLRAITGLDVPMGAGIFNNHLVTVSDNNSKTVSMWTSANTTTGNTAPDEALVIPAITAEGSFAYAP